MKILIFLLFVLACQLSIASTFQPFRFNNIDTSITSQTPYKLNEDEFLKMYGKDDSSKALIKFFFYKRNRDKKLLYVAPLPLVIAGALSIIYFNQTPSSSTVKTDDFGDIFIILLLALAIEGTLALAINGTIGLMIFSRKKMLKRLNNYFSGKGLPKHLARNKIFRQLLATGQVINRRQTHYSSTHREKNIQPN